MNSSVLMKTAILRGDGWAQRVAVLTDMEQLPTSVYVEFKDGTVGYVPRDQLTDYKTVGVESWRG